MVNSCLLFTSKSWWYIGLGKSSILFMARCCDLFFLAPYFGARTTNLLNFQLRFYCSILVVARQDKARQGKLLMSIQIQRILLQNTKSLYLGTRFSWKYIITRNFVLPYYKFCIIQMNFKIPFKALQQMHIQSKK